MQIYADKQYITVPKIHQSLLLVIRIIHTRSEITVPQLSYL